jgi:hypothetical protein
MPIQFSQVLVSVFGVQMVAVELSLFLDQVTVELLVFHFNKFLIHRGTEETHGTGQVVHGYCLAQNGLQWCRFLGLYDTSHASQVSKG